jgi:type II secretory pathway pseudopilin PulG
MTRRCLTLLEVLIVLVLLGALVAMVMPALLDRLDERAFEAAADGTNEQLMMARAHAQATGEPVEVTYSPKTGELQARRYAPWGRDFDAGTVEPGTSPLADRAGTGRPTSHSSAGDQSDSSSSASNAQVGGGLPGMPAQASASTRDIAEPWATRLLGRGIRIGTHPPGATTAPQDDSLNMLCDPGNDALASVASDDGSSETLADLERGQDVRLAVFMPDGSAMLGEDLWLNDDDGRWGRISINPWSGLPMFQRLADLTSEAMNGSGSDNSAAGAVDDSTSPDALLKRPASKPTMTASHRASERKPAHGAASKPAPATAAGPREGSGD